MMNKEIFECQDQTQAGRASHSKNLDELLGFEVDRIERELLLKAQKIRPGGHLWSLGQGLHKGSQTWIGLDPQVIQTPYAELVEILGLLDLEGGKKVVDLGAGYGRMGIVLNSLYPSSSFLGLELVKERVTEGMRIFKKLSLSAELIEQDLTQDNVEIPMADIYFIYDFGEIKHIKKILELLPADKKFHLVARGKGSQGLIDHKFPWLSDVAAVIRKENFSIYSNL
jgi:hypothetical protein